MSLNSRKILLSITTLWFFTIGVVGQSFYYKKYGVHDGLPSEIIKGVNQDVGGYLWIATDEGVVRYDGVNFIAYPDIAHSHYMKGFVNSSDNRLFLYGDLDFYEIVNGNDSVSFNTVCTVSRIIGDSLISYPKSIYEDNQHRFWVAENQSVVRLSDNDIKRFHFGEQDRTTQFLRSFSFFEDQLGELYVSSFQGNLFKIKNDTLENYPLQLPADVEYLGVHMDVLIIGAKQGIFQAPLLDDGGIGIPSLLQSIPYVSYVKALSNGMHFVATRGENHFLANDDFSDFYNIPHKINNINNVFESREKDIWLSSNEGLVLLKENLFQEVTMQNDFIEAAAENPKTKNVLYASSEKLYEYNPRSNESRLISEIQGGYYQSIVFNNQGLWIANAFNIFHSKDDHLVQTFDFDYRSRFVSDLIPDSKENIWVIVDETSVHKIDSTLAIKSYKVPIQNKAIINSLKEGRDGIYVTSSGMDSYLYYMEHGDSLFRNISIPITFDANPDITGIEIFENEIYLSSSIGLLKLQESSIEKVNLGDQFTSLPIRSLVKYSENKLLFSNSYGLMSYDLNANTFDLFNESYGLPSRTISPSGIMVSADSSIWVSTSKGLSYSTRVLSKERQTNTPVVVTISINGQTVSSPKDIQIEHNATIAFELSAITFPEKDVNYQYRLSKSAPWITSTERIILNNLPPGINNIEVRAKKYGTYSWSDIHSFSFQVQKPFWEETWFLLLVSMVIFLLVLFVYWITSLTARNKQILLQKIVDEKTAALKSANEDLIQLNEEKNNLMQMVAHDLKNPLTQIQGLIGLIKEDKELAQSEEMFDMINTSTDNLTEMISKILDVKKAEERQLQLKLEAVQISEFLLEIISPHEVNAQQKSIQIKKEIEEGVVAKVDKGFLNQICDNLISNALKFTPPETTIWIKLTTENKHAILEVTDEGPGLTEADMKICFQKFKTASARPTGGESSTGLGLSIVKKLVDEMNGKIWVKSEAGNGASFFVSFPIQLQKI